jgi:hypothetical protein
MAVHLKLIVAALVFVGAVMAESSSTDEASSSHPDDEPFRSEKAPKEPKKETPEDKLTTLANIAGLVHSTGPLASAIFPAASLAESAPANPVVSPLLSTQNINLAYKIAPSPAEIGAFNSLINNAFPL